MDTELYMVERSEWGWAVVEYYSEILHETHTTERAAQRQAARLNREVARELAACEAWEREGHGEP